MDFVTAFGLPLAYIALVLGALAAIVFPLLQMFQDLKKAKAALFGIGAVVVLFVLCFLLTGEEEAVGELATAGQMKMVEASMFAFYVMLAVSVVSVIYSTVSRYFK